MIIKDESINVLFELKQKFLRLIPHPKLILSAIKKASRQNQNSEPIEQANSVKLEVADEKLSLKDFLNYRITKELELKKIITDAETFEGLADDLRILYRHQVTICLKLQTYLPDSEEELADSEIKMSDPFDLYALLKSLSGLNTDEEIREKIKVELRDHTFENSAITNACLRANKIIANG